MTDEIDGFWHAKARAEAARAAQLEEDMARAMRRFAEIEGTKLVISAPAFIPVLLRDLAALAIDPGGFSAAEQAWLSRVARNAADMLDRQKTTKAENHQREG